MRPFGPRRSTCHFRNNENVQVDDEVVIGRLELDRLIVALSGRGYEVSGPVVRDGAIVHGPIAGTGDLPVGCHDHQSPGSYRLEEGPDDALFGWAVGPASWKASFFPPRETVWRAEPSDRPGVLSISEPTTAPAPMALFGARPCEVAAIEIQDRVLAEGEVPDPSYVRRRTGTFVVVAECGAPASTCFCTSMGTGPGARSGYDLALCELPAGPGGDHEYLVRIGSPRGAEVLADVPHRAADAAQQRAREDVISTAERRMSRTLDVDGLREVLAENIEHPRWDETAERCLSCGNCTLVCPTCFCSDVTDVSDLSGTIERERNWSSCFDRAHSYVHGGPVRPTTASCYRQWLTHKLGTWWDQFDTSGCVGCGRCITWCPVGIDLTEEAAVLRATSGTTTGEQDA